MKSDPPDGGRPRAADLAIIGLGALFPKAGSLEAFWANINHRVDGISEVPASHWRPDDYFHPDPLARDRVYAKWGGFLDPMAFNPLEFGISPRDVEAVDTTQLLGLMAAKAALTDAGYGPDRNHDHARTSVILGVTGALEMVVSLGARMGHPIWRRALLDSGLDNRTVEEVAERISGSYVEWQENSFPGLLGNVAAGRIANRLDLGGTNCVVDAACASSLGAVHLAALELETGRSDLVVTGGMDTFNDPFMYACFSKTPALSPTGRARPFSREADGTILGEGLGVIVLKRLSDARRDGDRVYAVIKGMGSSSDGKGMAVYAPNPKGQAKALRQALALAEVEPQTVELIEAHGTGTKVGDRSELSALMEVYQTSDRAKPWCALGSVKSQIGHTKAAAGAAGLIKAALALHHKVLPPTLYAEKPLEELTQDSPFYLNPRSRPWLPSSRGPRRAGVSAFGFGGSNFHAILEEAGPEKTEIDWDGQVQILAASAPTPQGFKTAIEDWAAADSQARIRSLAAESRKRFDPQAPCRLIIVTEGGPGDLASRINDARSLTGAAPKPGLTRAPDGVWLGQGAPEGRLALIFPGQGSQYLNMLGDLACRFPEMQEALALADAVYREGNGGPSGKGLGRCIYPTPALSEEQRRADETALKDTRRAQPALGAIGLGLFRILTRFGVRPDFAGGHSYGELLALCAAGRYGDRDFFRLSSLRGRLMADPKEGRGSMLAVMAPADEVEQSLKAKGLDLTVANRNAPRQTVISGSDLEIDRAAEVFQSLKWKNIRLEVSGAFHSRFMEPALQPFSKALADIVFQPESIPVFANSTARPYPIESEACREILAGQLVRPVEFVAQIDNMFDQGARTFVEVGPGRKLTGLIRSILADRPHQALAIDPRDGKRSAMFNLASALAHLAAEGRPLDLTAWDQDFRPVEDEPSKTRFTVSICGANQFRQREDLPPVRDPRKPTPMTPPLSEKRPGTMSESPTVPDSRTTIAPEPDPKPNPGAHRDGMHQALKATQDHLAMLQEFQSRTAKLHEQFLAGQEKALSVMEQLIRQQENLFRADLGRTLESSVPNDQPRPVLTDPGLAPLSPSDQVTIQPQAFQVAAPAPPSQPLEQETSESRQTAADLAATLLEVVAEATGYPAEMLGLDMALDADLGVDSIKRVEIFSKLAEKMPSLPELGPDQLGTLNTLGDVVAFLEAATPATDRGPKPTVDAGQLAATLLEVVAEATGYPAEMLGLDMALDADLGVDSIKRVEIFSKLAEKMPSLPELGPDQLGTLNTLGDVVAFLEAATPATDRGSRPKADADALARALVEVTAEATGYPAEMLNLDMALDADLGVDSIKRVEIFSKLAEKMPSLPELGPDQLGTLNTLGDVVKFLTGITAPKSSEPVSQSASSRDSLLQVETLPAANDDPCYEALCRATAERTGYPRETLTPELRLQEDLGLDPVGVVDLFRLVEENLPQGALLSAAEMPAPETLAQAAALLRKRLQTDPEQAPKQTGPEAGLIRLTPRIHFSDPGTEAPIPVPCGKNVWILADRDPLTKALAAELTGLGLVPHTSTWTDPLPDPSDLTKESAGLILIWPREADGEATILRAFEAIRKAGPGLRTGGTSGQAFLAVVTRLGGTFGLEKPEWRGDPAAAGLHGLGKTVGLEWPEVRTKVLDLDDALAPEALAGQTTAEIFRTGPVEVGFSAQGRCLIRLQDEPSSLDPGAPPVEAGDLVVITGGARGVTAAAALALGRAFRPTLALLGRSPAPENEPDWMAGLNAEPEIKRAIMDHAGRKLTPRDLKREFRRITAAREIRATLDALGREGLTAVYQTLDVRESEAAARVLAELQEQFGPVRGLVHGAGILADKKIEDKTSEQFSEVLGTKVSGLNNLLSTLDLEALKFLALFSSSTGRFGRVGQIDYAAANEVLNKTAQALARQNPGLKARSFNWGPWAGGMVTPGLKRLFDLEGIALIPLDSGADFLVRELASKDGDPVELVVLGPGSKLPGIEILSGPKSPASPQPIWDEATGLTFDLTVKSHPYLADHVLDGRAVLPMALIMEWMGQAVLKDRPGLEFIGIEDLKVPARLELGPQDRVSIRVTPAEADADETGLWRIPVRLTRHQGEDTEEQARGLVVLAANPELAPTAQHLAFKNEFPEPDHIYGPGRLFHGPMFQALSHIDGHSKEGAEAWARTAAPPAKWSMDLPTTSWLTDPLALDAGFQLATLWGLEHEGYPSLPVKFRSFRQYRRQFPENGVRVNLRILRSSKLFVIADLEILDEKSRVVARMEELTLVLSGALVESYSRNRLESGADRPVEG